MNYSDSVERSAEFLRQAIPYMSKQSAALHPLSYAVWYEYVSGRNEALRQQIDQLLSQDGKLDERSTMELYARHVAEVDPVVAARVAEDMQRLLAGMAESAAHTGAQTEQFGTSLTQLSAQLQASNDESAQNALIDDVLSNTLEMRAAVELLKKRLDDSRKEILSLREEVTRARSDAMLDSLTGLANRRAFDLALAQCLEDATLTKDGVCLVMVDIDHFKRVNDTHGHLFGDRVIRAVAQAMKAMVKGQDTAARIGGEEFAILLPSTPPQGALVLAEKIRAAIAQSRIRRGQEQLAERITVSLGVTSYAAGETESAFIERADAALYASKTGGRDRVSLIPAPVKVSVD